MRGFKDYILNEGQLNDDIALLSTKILEDKENADVYWDMVIELLEPVNRRKAELVRWALGKRVKSGFNIMAKTGQHGFMCVDYEKTNPNFGYPAYINGSTRPSLEIHLNLEGLYKGSILPLPRKEVVAHIGFKKEICDGAAKRQMGVAEYIGEELDIKQLDLNRINIVGIRRDSGGMDSLSDAKESDILYKELLMNTIKNSINQGWLKDYTRSGRYNPYFVANDFEIGYYPAEIDV